MSDAKSDAKSDVTPKVKTDKPKLTWIDIAITVTLLASIVGLAAWLLSGKFSYVAAPASSFGLVNLLKKPKEESETEAETSDAATIMGGEAVAMPATPDAVDGVVDGTDVYLPPTLLDNSPVSPDDRPEHSIDPFDSSLLEVNPAPASLEEFPTEAEAIEANLPSDLPDPSLTPTPTTSNVTPSNATATDQPIRYLSERYDQGERNFQSFDLRNLDLNYRILRLIDADLRELQAERASLQQIDLTQSNLGRADFQYAKLDGANLSYTNLSAANLCGASLRGANLRDAKLTDARLAIADLSYADLSGADLSGADLTDTNLYRARLDGAKLPEAVRRSSVS
jgi:uncharacterized protein YjbI with pentapeptide repeats